MARPNPIRKIMEAPLPSRTYQRRLQFRPAAADIKYAYTIINRHVFDNQLTPCVIYSGSLRRTWAYCTWLDSEQHRGTWSTIHVMDKWYCPQWFIQILAHEMVHQWQYDIYRWEYLDQFRRNMPMNSDGHGPSFFSWRDRFDHYGLHLQRHYGTRRWFKHQDFTRC